MRTRALSLIGLPRELATLTGLVEDVRDGRSGAVFIVGDPGVGKSRLLAEAATQAAAAGVTILRGRARALGPSAALQPFAEALAALSRQGRLPGRAELGAYLPLLSRVVPELAETTGSRVDSDDTPSIAVAEAILRVLAHCGWRDGGCLLLLDDLHLADVESLAVVDYLVDNLAGLPVGFVATVRSTGSTATELADSAARRSVAEVLQVHPLQREQVGAFAGACLAGDPVEDDVADLLWHASGGVPLVIEEILFSMVDAGQLQRGPDAWCLVSGQAGDAPASLVQNLADRVTGLGRDAREVVLTAAALGERFPLELVQHAVGLDDETFLRSVRAAVAAQLITPDERPDSYALAHPLIGEALLTTTLPVDRVRRARRLADGIEALWPGFPGEWCRVAAEMQETGGRPGPAAVLRRDAGRRATASGNATDAATEIERALRLFEQAGPEHADAAGEAFVGLVEALTAAGQLDRAIGLVRGEAGALASVAARLDRDRLADLHLDLAWAAYLIGRISEAANQLAAAGLILGAHPDPARQATLDAVEANVIIDGGDDTPHRLRLAEDAARRAVDVAERIGAAETACRAWHAIGRIARERDLDEAARCFDRIVELSDEKRLPTWRVHGLIGAAGNSWLQDGGRVAFDIARAEADRVGAVALGLSVEANLVLHSVLIGDYAAARASRASCLAELGALGATALIRYCRAGEAIEHGQRADRAAFTAAVERFHAAGGRDSLEEPMVLGMGSAICSLLELDPDRARRDLEVVRSIELRSPSTRYLAGSHGVRILLDVLGGQLDADGLSAALAATPTRMRWNRQFAELARAIAAGRTGDIATAQDACAAAAEAARPYPVGGHLARWLAAAEAAAAGWGEPEEWLREAETWFHEQSMGAAAADCRNRLRQIGATVRQRREGIDEVPAWLRADGVTVREYEVYLLALTRLGNRAIGERLHISPRTVEKHIAALVAKTGAADREQMIVRGSSAS